MITTISAIVSIVATAIGAGKGLVDLYQAIKSIVPAPLPKTASQLVKDEQSELGSVYEMLKISSEYVAEIFKRLRTQFIITAVVIMVTWATFLLTALFLTRLFANINLNVASCWVFLVGIAIAWYLANWPSKLSQVNHIKSALQEMYYSLVGGEGGLEGETSAVPRSKEVTELEARLSSVLVSYRRHISVLPELLSARPLSTSERDLLDAHIQLSCLVTSIEAYLLKTRLLEAKSKVQEASQQKILSILSDAFVALVHDKVLLTKPDDKQDYSKWHIHQQEVIRDEFRKLGFADWLTLVPNNSEFYKIDFTLLTKNTENLQATLEQFLGLSRKSSRRKGGAFAFLVKEKKK